MYIHAYIHLHQALKARASMISEGHPAKSPAAGEILRLRGGGQGSTSEASLRRQRMRTPTQPPKICQNMHQKPGTLKSCVLALTGRRLDQHVLHSELLWLATGMVSAGQNIGAMHSRGFRADFRVLAMQELCLSLVVWELGSV